MSFVNSTGTNVNRMLDSLGLPDSFGDAIGALIDARRGDLGGVARNLVDLQSGLPTSALDRAISGRSGRAFGRGFIPRCICGGAHLHRYANTYPSFQRTVARDAYIGQKYNYNVGPFQCQGRITGRQYCGSFSKPIQLKNDQWLFHGRTYNGLTEVWRDMRDGRVDGKANLFPNIPGPFLPAVPFCPSFPAGGAPTFPWNPLGSLTGAMGTAIQNLLNGNGGANGGSAAGGTGGAASDTGASGASDIMSGPGSLEDKLLLLMDKLGKHIDKQIEDQMKKIESEMAKQKQEGQGAKGDSGGGLFGTIGSIAGGVFGGPIGAAAGSAVGGALGNATSGGSGGSGSSNGSQNSNLQLLQSQLQQMVERRNQMFQTMTQMLKSLNDTSLSIIRNLKA